MLPPQRHLRARVRQRPDRLPLLLAVVSRALPAPPQELPLAAPASSVRAVVAALGANLAVSLLKFAGFALSGSGAMLSEAIHSTADTGNQLLLLVGLRRAIRRRDDDFQYGYGAERFVFGLLSASGIFFVGCGVTLYHGVQSLLHPHTPELGPATFAILGISFVIEGGVTAYAFASIYRERDKLPFLRHLRERTDPAALAVLLEDSVAVLGLLLAAAGILLTHLTGNPVWDSVGSLVVGVLLGLVALHLVLENRGLLLGKAVPDAALATFLRIARGHPGVRAVHDVKTRQLTPELFKFKAELVLDERYIAAQLRAGFPAEGESLSAAERERALLAVSLAAVNAVSDLLRSLEAAVRAELPQARHIDLEVDHTPDQEDLARTAAS